ncbi:hypothetical protein SCMU_16460 [Sinomonas cyclohexanicum]|uniref:DUF4157 domain-containing protein n=1 Tax=Sinomonas cyclohexanicum TaxID=322009 RepID=A0ABM7PU79_SINCY|nr:hypothetical protein SCMU_16460 [Corynebacterium cyclohexanicum]
MLNTLNLSTPLGLALAAAARTPLRRGPDGLFVAERYTPRLPVAGAFTVGNVILTRGSAEELLARRELLAHEARHATQYAACLGLPFLPLYFACHLAGALVSLAFGGDPASLNPFERLAGLEDGGYRPRKDTQP